MPILYINTIKDNNTRIRLELREGEATIAEHELEAERRQAELLLPSIISLLGSKNLGLKDLGGIIVENSGGSFTSLRIGIVTANTLGYALGIPVRGTHPTAEDDGDRGYSIVLPVYDKPPHITRKANNRG